MASSWHHSSVADEKRISLRLPTDLHARLVEQARTDRRSLNSEIIHLLEVTLTNAGGNGESPSLPRSAGGRFSPQAGGAPTPI
ncbi:Arc family DNA-binding protein [Streptomyces hirsutus]|uniref:Arc family DNA-binding protein n=1 Tax=Streptomyces hirsutus TaxID=35620 RepID=UPI0033C23444